jgi:hypothetical protein
MPVVITKHEGEVEDVFLCDCGGLTHSLCFKYFIPQPKDDPEDNQIYVSMGSEDYRTFWQRLVVSVKYLFNRQPEKDGFFNITSLRAKDMDRLARFIENQTAAKASVFDMGDTNNRFCVKGNCGYVLRFSHEVFTSDDGYIYPEFLASILREKENVFKRSWWGFWYALGLAKYHNSEMEFYLTPDDSAKLKALAQIHKDIAFS